MTSKRGIRLARSRKLVPRRWPRWRGDGVSPSAERGDCASISDALAMAAGGERRLSTLELDHLASCLRCRVEQSRYRRLMEAMRSLRESPVVGSDTLPVAQILGHLDAHGRRWAHQARSRVAAALGGVAAGAAATAGLIAFATRHRRTARLAS